MQEVSVSELRALLGAVSVVDVREWDEFRSGHVPGAVHIPLSTVPLRMAELDRNQRHYLVCQAGGRSGQAVAFLEQQGYDVVNVVGGTGDWLAAGYPVEVPD